MKDTEIKLKEIMYEFESDLCGPLYDLVCNVFVVLCCVCFTWNVASLGCLSR